MKKLLCKLFGHRSIKLENRAAGIPDELHLCERCGLSWHYVAIPQDRKVFVRPWIGLSDSR